MVVKAMTAIASSNCARVKPASSLRGLRVIDLGVREPFLWPLDLLHLPEEMSEVEVVVSKPDLPDGVRIVLPAGLTARAGFGSARQTRVTEAELVRKLETMGLDPDNAWEFSATKPRSSSTSVPASASPPASSPRAPTSAPHHECRSWSGPEERSWEEA